MTSRRAFFKNLIALVAAAPFAWRGRRVVGSVAAMRGFTSEPWTVAYRGYLFKWTGWRQSPADAIEVGQLLGRPNQWEPQDWVYVHIPGPWGDEEGRLADRVRALNQEAGFWELGCLD